MSPISSRSPTMPHSTQPSFGTSKSTPPSDPYYGYKEAACTSARFISSLYSCPDIPPKTSTNSPQLTLARFIAYALHRTRLPSLVTTSALLLLSRLKARFPDARGSSGHRLFLSALMTASKVICDDTYSNKSWCIVGQGMFGLREINQMERELLGYLKWDINVTAEQLSELEELLRGEFTDSPSLSPATSFPIPTISVVASPAIPVAGLASPDAYPSPPCSPISVSGGSYTSAASSEFSPLSFDPCSTPPNQQAFNPLRHFPASSKAEPSIAHSDRDEEGIIEMERWNLEDSVA